MAKLLIVEDERVSSESIRCFLEASNHQILDTVETGAEALQQVQKLSPDLVLMDIYLKGELDGITVAAQIYQQWGIPIIYLSANTEDTVLQRAIATKPFGYLVKPFNQVELITTIDIALQHHRLEQQLERTEQWLTTTLNSMGDGTIATDPQGRITFINPVAAAITGWTQTEALGVPVDQVLDLVDAQTYEVITNPLLQAIQTGQALTLPEHCVLRTKDGVERAIGDSAAPIRNRNGEILGGVLVFQDISDRQRAKNLLYQREQEFRALVEHSPDIIARFDRQLRHLYVNPAIETLTGIPTAAFIGRRNRDLGMPEVLSQYWDTEITAIFATGEERTLEFEIVTLDGIRYFQTRLVPEFAPDGQVATVLSVARDITDRTEIEATLRLQAEREAMLGALSQRIRASLELDDILTTAVNELRQLMTADRVLVYRFAPDWSGTVITEAIAPGVRSLLGQRFPNLVVSPDDYIQPWLRGQARIIDNVETAAISPAHRSLLEQLHIQASLVVPILQGEHLWGLFAVQQCATPRHWQDWEVDFLSRLAVKLSIAIHQSQLYQQTQALAQRERSLNRVMQTVRQSLHLNTIFDTAVTEIGNVLQVTQVSIVQYQPAQQIWVYRAIHHQDAIAATTYLGLELPDEGNPQTTLLKRGELVRVDDTTTLTDEFSQILARTFPGAWLKVPLRVGEVVWGAICLVQQEQPFSWQDWQVELTQMIADQLAIAIHQAELYTEVQRLNLNLESQVLERTMQVQQSLAFEALLKRITDNVRDSLDENQILHTAVTELGQGLEVIYCGAALYSPDLQSGLIAHEFVQPGFPVNTSHTLIIADEITRDVYYQLFQAQDCQFCLTVPNPDRPTECHHAILACPIWDDQEVLGDLWLFRPVDAYFSDVEVRLVQQVANQCAIALRQSRLYQAAQNQVTALERLNQLKDDFLSTISHELRTPMANIKLAIQLLNTVLTPAQVLATVPNANRYFQILQQECDREIVLIDNLLKLSRLDTDSEPLNLCSIDPVIWLSHAVEPFVERVCEYHLTLSVEVPPTLPPLTTDLTCLAQILTELLTNACKYSPPGESIIVTAWAEGGTVHIAVTNTGIEVPAEEVPRIFDTFYRIPNRDPWRYAGTGIGLALVKKLVAHIGATIAVESGDGQTTFRVTIPPPPPLKGSP